MRMCWNHFLKGWKPSIRTDLSPPQHKRMRGIEGVSNMDKFNLFVTNHWKYYIALEDEILSTEKYIEFDEINYNTFSIEYLMLFQAVCSEIDVIGKQLSLLVNEDFKPRRTTSITDWWYQIQDAIRESLQKPVVFCDKITINPWKGYAVEKYLDSKNRTRYRLKRGAITPSWWTAYNKVKHQRSTIENGNSNYTKANFKNLINAYAGLYILEKECLRKTGDESVIRKITCSKLFEHENWTKPEDVQDEIENTATEFANEFVRYMRMH